jgi:putative transcriptional regulator
VTGKRYKSKILASVHGAMQDAFDAGVIDKKTMRHFDESCLTETEPMTPRQLIALRKREGVSQAVLARHLNVAVKLVGEWERGEKRPSGPSLKLLALVKSKGLDAIA